MSPHSSIVAWRIPWTKESGRLQSKGSQRVDMTEVTYLQSCLTLFDPKDHGQPGSSVLGVSQARILEWVAISFSRGSLPPKDTTCVPCIVGEFFTTEPPRKHLSICYRYSIRFATILYFYLKIFNYFIFVRLAASGLVVVFRILHHLLWHAGSLVATRGVLFPN